MKTEPQLKWRSCNLYEDRHQRGGLQLNVVSSDRTENVSALNRNKTLNNFISSNENFILIVLYKNLASIKYVPLLKKFSIKRCTELRERICHSV